MQEPRAAHLAKQMAHAVVLENEPRPWLDSDIQGSYRSNVRTWQDLHLIFENPPTAARHQLNRNQGHNRW
jgi:D-alanyl-D-alanine carboxypeptidase